MKNVIQFFSNNNKAIIILSLIVVLYFMFTAKGKETVTKVVVKAKNKQRGEGTLADAWNNSSSSEFTKEVFYKNQEYIAQIKHIKGYDNALLSSGEVLIYDTDAEAWMPAVKTDLV